MLAHQRPRVVEQHFLRDAAELGKRTLHSGKPTLLAFMAERPRLQAARIAQRRDKHERLDLDAGDVDEALAKINLQLLAGRRLNRVVARAAAIRARRYGATARSIVRRLTTTPFSAASSWRTTSALPRWRSKRSLSQPA